MTVAVQAEEVKPTAAWSSGGRGQLADARPQRLRGGMKLSILKTRARYTLTHHASTLSSS